MPKLIKYLQQRINKITIIETKKEGKFVGTITQIDSKHNLTVRDAMINGKRIEKIFIKGNDLRSFEL